MSNGMFTCTIRKLSTGYKIAAFCGDSLDDLRTISMTLMRASEWCRCFVVCLDWHGNMMFTLQPQGQGVPEPGAGLPMPPQAPAARLPMGGVPARPAAPSWDSYEGQMQAMRAAAREASTPHRAPQLPAVVEGVFEEDVPRALPPYRR